MTDDKLALVVEAGDRLAKALKPFDYERDELFEVAEFRRAWGRWPSDGFIINFGNHRLGEYEEAGAAIEHWFDVRSRIAGGRCDGCD